MERGKKRLEKLRKRRLKAVALFEQGERQCSVAQHLRVSRQSVSEWWLAWHNGDTKALNGATRAGRKPRLGACRTESSVQHELHHPTQPNQARAQRNCPWC